MLEYKKQEDGSFVIIGAQKIVDLGQAIEWGWIQVGRDRSIGYTSNVDKEDVKRCLHTDAIRELPPGTRYELRQRQATNYGRTHGMAWYWTQDFEKVEDWKDPGEYFDREIGCLRIGRFTTPTRVNTTLPVAETAPKIGGE